MFFFVYTELNDRTGLFQTIQLSMSTKLNGSKYCYVSVTIQLNVNHLFKHSEMIKQIFLKNQFSVSIVLLHIVKCKNSLI